MNTQAIHNKPNGMEILQNCIVDHVCKITAPYKHKMLRKKQCKYKNMWKFCCMLSFFFFLNKAICYPIHYIDRNIIDY